MRSIYWFKRDLRIEDNRALLRCLTESKEVYPIFIFDDDILKRLNAFDNRFYFLKSVIDNLKNKIKISIFYGRTSEIFEYVIQSIKPDFIYTCQSLTWEGEERNDRVKIMAKNNNIDFIEVFDNFLVDVRKIAYTKVYSQFYKKWRPMIDSRLTNIDKKLLEKTKEVNINKFNISNNLSNLKPTSDFYWTFDFLKQRLNNFDFKNYFQIRNDISNDGTSKLSPYIRFGVISVRSIYERIRNISEDFAKELAWREFWYHIRYYFPEMKNLEFQENRRNLKWENNEKYLDSFINAKTGYPIIDAAIIQLKKENWMHNRARMIVGSFLTKDLLIDWRIGEEFFAKYLIDYDEVVNVGNWQWIASVGPDPKPLRIFNPIIQAQKFDPNSSYILKYLPDLINEDKKGIINPLQYKLYNYYSPIIDHYQMIKKIKSFKKNKKFL